MFEQFEHVGQDCGEIAGYEITRSPARKRNNEIRGRTGQNGKLYKILPIHRRKDKQN